MLSSFELNRVRDTSEKKEEDEREGGENKFSIFVGRAMRINDGNILYICICALYSGRSAG